MMPEYGDCIDYDDASECASHAVAVGEAWGPLRIGEPPSVAKFPVDVLPESVQQLVVEGAAAIGCAVDFLAVPALAVAAGAIGRTAALRLKEGYFASSSLFAACVGPPADGKTPALKIAAAPLRKLDAALALEHAEAMDRWRAECDRASPDGKKAKPPGGFGHSVHSVRPPRPRRIDVDDVTMEALPLILADNPRGLVMVRDELTALVMGLNQYKSGKGSDRANLLKIWSGDAFKRDRVAHENHEPVRCDHPCLSIVGGLPPDMLGELVDQKGRSDGFTDRFLFSCPDVRPAPSWSAEGVPDVVADEWSNLVERLWLRSPEQRDGRPVPRTIVMDAGGESAWRHYYDRHSEEMNDTGFPPSLRGPWGKLREYAGRLTLVLSLLDHASDPLCGVQDLPVGDDGFVEDAWRLVDYFKSHARRVHAAVNLGVEGPDRAVAKALLDWLRNEQIDMFTERDAKRARRWIEPDALANALRHLTRANAVRPEPPQMAAKCGRPRSPAYEVNPALLV